MADPTCAKLSGEHSLGDVVMIQAVGMGQQAMSEAQQAMSWESVSVVAGLTEVVKCLEDRVSAVELSDGHTQQALRDLVNIKTEYGGEEEAEGSEWDGRSITTELGDELVMMGQVAQPSTDQLGGLAYSHPSLPWPLPQSISLVFPMPLPYTPSPSPHGYRSSTVTRKPQEFDGQVSLEAYLAHFEMLVEAQRWDKQEKAVQLASSLKEPVMEAISPILDLRKRKGKTVDTGNSSRLGKGGRNQLVLHRPVSCTATMWCYWTLHNTTKTSGGQYMGWCMWQTLITRACWGLDYLLESHACLDFRKMCIELQGKEVPLLKANASTQLQSVLLVGKILVRPDDKQVCVLVTNLGDEEWQIPAGAAVGSCEAVELAYEVPGSGFKVIAVIHGLSAHLEDLQNRSIVCLDKEQAVQLG
ncbi:hypothetical protein O3P69_020650 [Scylla paramamosain]|uniref:Uncharacterized protein n=1 Tax=Scylla paramamosain TaxID=85552 RepID=A0AAW0TQ78_SCYPA